MDEAFNLQDYMTKGVEKVVANSLRATFRDPRESAFMVRFAAASRRASRRRAEEEKAGLHVPPFLIASITSQCNLHCAGCYSRVNEATVDSAPVCQLSAEEWRSIFRQAQELGVSFILLAGGEPLLRRDIMEAACGLPDIIFPVFTNGTFMDDAYYRLFDRNRNLIPVLSIEGNREATDSRRGSGIYDRLTGAMDELHSRSLLYGASVTVTTENLQEVSSPAFISSLEERGCKLVIFVEFVPVTREARHLAPGDAEREQLREAIISLRENRPETIFISFPGDEKTSGGCLAAGRGFFHINSHGGAEPCPFSPFSDTTLKDTPLREALRSPLFLALQDHGVLQEDHAGGCVLYEKRDQVVRLLREQQKTAE